MLLYFTRLKKGTTLYLSSDGFADQNNVLRKKYGTDNLINILYTNHQLSLPEQQRVLESSLDRFMTNTEQRDDILLIGIKI